MLKRFGILAALVVLSAAPAQAQGTIMPAPVFHGFTNAGAPCASCKLYTYDAGTTTPRSTFSDSALSVANANPTVLDSSGRAAIFLSPTIYKFVLKTAADATLWTADNVGATPTTNVSLDVTGTAGESLSAGDVVYLSDGSGSLTAGRWYKADADAVYASSTALYVGMMQAALASGVSGSIRIQGRVSGLSALTAGTRYYASATAGALTSTAPSNARFVGSADSTTTILIAPNPNFVPQIGQDLVFTGNHSIRRDTADAADSGSVTVTGGGAASSARGAQLSLYGNENAATGRIIFTPGNVANSDFTLNDSAGGFQIANFVGATGIGTLTSTAAAAWLLNSTAANGGYLTVQRSGTGLLQAGSAEAIDAALGTVGDGAVKATNLLFLESGATDGVRSMTVYNNTDAGAANVVVLADGSIQRSSSSARYKTHIERLTDWTFLLNLEPVTFTSVTAPNGKRYGGLLAESVAAVAPEYAVLNADGLPDEVAYGHLVAPLIAAVKDLTAELEVLRARLAALEAK